MLHLIYLVPFHNSNNSQNPTLVKSLHEKGEAKIEKKIEQYARYSNKGKKKMVIKLGDWV